MATNRVKGAAKKAAGKVQSAYGRATNQSEHVVKGEARKAEGAVQSAIGKIGNKLK